MARTISNEKLSARICPNCGGKLIIEMEESIAICQYCGTEFDLPISKEARKEYFETKERQRKERNREKLQEEQRQQERQMESNARMGQIVAVTAAVVVVVIAIIMENRGSNEALMELVGAIAIVAAAAALGKKNSTFVDLAVTIAGGVLTIILSRFVSNGVMIEMGGGLAIIVAIICYVKTTVKNK